MVRQSQLTNAREEAEKLGLNKSDKKIKNFIKIETSVKSGDPRNISPRTDKMLSVLGPYVAALEGLMKLHPRLVKGMNNADRDKKMGTLRNFGAYLETDFSRFDMSLCLSFLLSFELITLTRYFDMDDQLYADALSALLETEGVSEVGLCYLIYGTRCSGDAHTSIGNGLINDFLTWLCVPEHCEHFHEGDDGIIACDAADVDQIRYNLCILPVLGFQIKVDVYNDLHQVSFCGRFLYDNESSGVGSYCDLKRTLAKFHTICSDGDAQALLLAKSMSIYSSDGHTPIIGPLSLAIIRILKPIVCDRRLKRAKLHLVRDGYSAERIRFDDGLVVKDVCPQVRASVALRTGYHPGLQIAFEKYYASWVKLGMIPSNVIRLPDHWEFDETSTVYGRVCEYVV